jgi:hypothetical protein
MEGNGQLHTLDALSLGKEHLVTTARHAASCYTGSCNNKAVNEISGVSPSLLSTYKTDYTAVTTALISAVMRQIFIRN